MRARLAVLFCLLLVAPAHASRLTFGSDLTGTADTTQSHPRDWAAYPSGASVPAQGEVKLVQLKGIVQRPVNDAAYAGRYPDFQFHVVVLRPQSDGTQKLIVGSTDMPVPYGGDPARVTTLYLQSYDSRLCVLPGDEVAIATSGGFGNHVGFPDDFFADGYPVQMFARGGQSYKLFEQSDGTGSFQQGNSVRFATVEAQELLMRVTVGTGADARFSCRTAAEKAQNLPNPSPYVIPTPTPTGTPTGTPPGAGTGKATPSKFGVKVTRKAATFRVGCAKTASCTGVLSIVKGKTVYGSRRFSIAAGKHKTVVVTFTKKARKTLARRHKTVVKVRAVTRGASTAVSMSLRFGVHR